METIVARYSMLRTGLFAIGLAAIGWMLFGGTLTGLLAHSRSPLATYILLPALVLSWLAGVIYALGVIRQILTRESAAVWAEDRVLHWGPFGRSLPLDSILGTGSSVSGRTGDVRLSLQLAGGKTRTIDATLFRENAVDVSAAIRDLVAG